MITINGKNLSVLGDSISTYRGVSDDTLANATLRYNPYYYRPAFPREKMYWQLVMDRLGLTLCVNNSWSGGNLSGRDNPDSGVNRARQLARDDGTMPNLILLFMGINDLGRGVKVDVFAADYRRTLEVCRETYPQAAICCVNLPDRDPSVTRPTEVFNAAIEAAAREAGERCFVADLFHSRWRHDDYYMNTRDGLHPDGDGMRMIADVVEAAIREQCHFE